MEVLIIVSLLIIAAETTYLTAASLQKEKRTSIAPIFVDTSVLIDGRIISVAQSGFMSRPLFIPRSVVGELQFLADNADTEKRSRARHGLDVINQLQSIDSIKTHIFPDGVKADEGVDNRLLTLAKKHKGALCTIDYNLNKVAVVEGIEVLNVNDLAKTLRLAYLPGEHTQLELTQKGNDTHQAVGHLGDGTMVVVEHANKYIGSTVEVEFIRGLQTAAGKMMFAKLAHQPQTPTKQAKPAKVAVKATKPVRPASAKSTVENANQERTVKKQVSSKPQTTKRTERPSNTSNSRNSSASQSQQPRRKTGGRNTRPRSHEDALVELANR